MAKYKYKKYFYAEDPEYRSSRCYFYYNEGCSIASKNCPGTNNCEIYQKKMATIKSEIERRNESKALIEKAYIENQKKNSETHYNLRVIISYDFPLGGMRDKNNNLLHQHMFALKMCDFDYKDEAGEILNSTDINIKSVIIKKGNNYYNAYIDDTKVHDVKIMTSSIFTVKSIDIIHPIDSKIIMNLINNSVLSTRDNKYGYVYFIDD